MIIVIGKLEHECFLVPCPGCPADHRWGGDQMYKEQQCDDCGKTYMPVRPEDKVKEAMRAAIAEIVEYLNSNKLNQVGSGSMIHQHLREALKEAL